MGVSISRAARDIRQPSRRSPGSREIPGISYDPRCSSAVLARQARFDFHVLRLWGRQKSTENVDEMHQRRLTAWRRARAMPLVTVEAIILGENRLELQEAAVSWGSHQPPKAIHARPSCYQLSNVWAATLKHARRQKRPRKNFRAFCRQSTGSDTRCCSIQTLGDEEVISVIESSHSFTTG